MRDRRSTPAPERLVRHERARKSFRETFGRTDEAVIAEMDREGDDIPNQSPAVPVLLQRIGVTREAIPVTIVDPFDPSGRAQIACTVEAHAELDPGRRGIHISRVGDALARLSGDVFPSLQHYALALAAEIRTVQEADVAEVRVSGVLSYVEDFAGVKRKQSIEHLKLGAFARRSGAETSCSTSLGFNHITACPCVQKTFQHALAEEHRALLEEIAESEAPLLTHSQRCSTVVTIAGDEKSVAITELLAAIDEVAVRSQNTMPRELELLNVHRAHAEPRFLEDALRDMLRSVYRAIRDEHPATTITIDATSMESIHDFDISGSIRYAVAELRRIFPD